MGDLTSFRNAIRSLRRKKESVVISDLQTRYKISKTQQQKIASHAAELINNIRADDEIGLMEVFLKEYGLSTDEGVALMCLAEALLRVPDDETIDDLIEDKIAPSAWGEHLGKSSSSLVNASTWGLMLTGKVLDTEKGSSIASILHQTIKRLGEPVIRLAVKRAMKEMGQQFVLGETITDAIKRGEKARQAGFTYSYDMLGEAAITEQDAQRYFATYKQALTRISEQAKAGGIQDNPGISIKLSALHPRYEVRQRGRVLLELTERLRALCFMAKSANIGLNIDAEEADRLDLSLDIIEAVLSDPELAGWNGFGVVVQAYGKSSSAVIDWLYALAEKLDRKIMIRLVKGAYWDSEIKRAQVFGLENYPVFTRKSATDISYICCAKQLLGLADRIYPQFATHNAHSIAAILELAQDKSVFEFQRLHGMGTVLHRQILESEKTRCRIYAPVGQHKDLLAYLVRRLLENGANSSFVNQIVDEDIPPEEIAMNPFDILLDDREGHRPQLPFPKDLYAPQRRNSKGWDFHDYEDIARINQARQPFKAASWDVKPILKGRRDMSASKTLIVNPAILSDNVGSVTEATIKDVNSALQAATPWQKSSMADRARILNKAANIYEDNFGEIFAVLSREAGKVIPDAIAEIREAVDFLRYYASQASELDVSKGRKARGIITCISPWNFPLAIFTGQIAAALAAGNGVIAKPAETTPIIASLAVKYLHQAGVPKTVLQFLPGQGSIIGRALVSDPRVNGVCFTGSTETAQIINKNMAATLDPTAPLVAETGGLNAMIVDSTALPEQAVSDVIASAFQSAGQRCSALRIVYVQADIAANFTAMLKGAMDELKLGDPWDLSTDIGPIIDASAQKNIQEYVQNAETKGKLLKSLEAPENGHFIGPTLLSVSGIGEMNKEIFGPVLHLASFEAEELPQIIQDINASGYGLTFGLHTRIDGRVETFTNQIEAGNIYVNRNQIGAVVGTQPFGGEKRSGTGPKAGGPNYVKRFTTKQIEKSGGELKEKDAENVLPFETVQGLLSKTPKAPRQNLHTINMPGPTGESNRLSEFGRGTILCLGPGAAQGRQQAEIARTKGCITVSVFEGADGGHALNGRMDYSHLQNLSGFDGVAFWGSDQDARLIRQALANRRGPICPLIGAVDMAEACVIERHICIDTTASGGNVALLAQG